MLVRYFSDFDEPATNKVSANIVARKRSKLAKHVTETTTGGRRIAVEKSVQEDENSAAESVLGAIGVRVTCSSSSEGC